MKKIAFCMSLLICKAWGLSCSTPVTLSEPGQSPSYFGLSMNDEGEALVTWFSRDLNNNNKIMVAATRDGEKKWSIAPISGLIKQVHGKKHFIDAKGNSYVFWDAAKEDNEGENVRFYQFAKHENNKGWSPTVNVLDPEDRISYSINVFDSQGNILLFGTSEDIDPEDRWKTYQSIVALHYQNGQKKRIEISKSNQGNFYPKHLIRNKSAEIFALWEENTFTHDPKKGIEWRKTIKGSCLHDGTSWSTPVKISDVSDDDYCSDFRGLMNSKRDMVIAWDKNNRLNGLHQIQAVTYLDGRWSEPLELAASKKGFSGFSMQLNDKGHILASWTKTEKGKKVIYVADKPVGQPWSSSIALSDLEQNTGTFELSLDHEGNIVVVWTAKEGKKDVIYVADKPVGQPWSSSAVLLDPAKVVRELQLCKDNQGNALVVWTNKEGRREALYAIYKPANQAWTSPVRISGEVQHCYQFKVKTNNLGHFVIIQNECSQEGCSIHGDVLSTATGEWSSFMISPEGQDCVGFKLKFNKKGQGLIAWSVEDDEEYIQVAELNVD